MKNTNKWEFGNNTIKIINESKSPHKACFLYLRTMKADIQTVEDIHLLVVEFYENIKQDALLGPIFLSKVDDWEKHFEKMTRFWQSLLMDEVTYKGKSFEPHKELDINSSHFDHWIQLWATVIDKHFEGDVAEQAKYRAKTIGAVYTYKLDALRQERETK